MTVFFSAPYVTVFDGDGNPVPGAKAFFYNPGTTTLRTVYANAGLTTPHTNPVIADSAGRLPMIFLPAGAFKVRLTTSAGALIEEEDNVDPGQSTSAGALAVASGGTGATTAAAARSNLGVPSQAAFDALDARVVAVETDVATAVIYTAGTTTWASTITPAFGTNNIMRCVLQGNTTVNAPTGIVDGQEFILELVQDASGNRSIAMNSAYKPPNGVWPSFSVAPNAVDVIKGYRKSAGNFQIESIKIEDNLNRPAPDIIAADQQAAGTDGGTATAGAWQTRTLNTLNRNRASLGSLNSNQITLPAGTYYIEAEAPAYGVNEHQIKIINATDAADVALGTVVSAPDTQQMSVVSSAEGFVTISSQKAFAIQHRVTTTKAANGYGRGGAWGTNVYARMRIWKCT